MSIEEVTLRVGAIVDFPTLGYDEDLFKFGLVDSLALVEIASDFGLDLSTFTRESWGTCRKLCEVINHDAS